MPRVQLFPTSQRSAGATRRGRVAIITRTKDRPLLLARAFASVLDQCYPHWHLYLVNDGGDPQPVEALAAQYQTALDDRMTLIHHPRSLGMEAASNAGLAAIRDCEYVIVHDDDDAWHPQFLQQTVRFLESPANAGYVAVAARCEVIHEEIVGDEVIERRREPWSFWKPQVDLLDQLAGNRFPPICLLIRRSAVDHIGPFNADLPVLGDWDYNLRLLMLGDIGTINSDLAFYHHRIDGQAGSIYGNSVHSGLGKHLTYQTLYRNSLLRMLLQKEPGFLGLAHVLLKGNDALGERIESGALRAKLDHMHYDINHDQNFRLLQPLLAALPADPDACAKLGRDAVFVFAALHKLLRPIHWVWRQLLPLRHLIARLRGRI